MTWETFYLICFLAGLMLSALSLLGGMGHIGSHIHVPHVSHLPHMPSVGHLPHGAHLPHGVAQAGQGTAGSAAGYLLTRYGSFVAGVVLLLALVCGVAGGAIVFFFLAKVLLPHERELTADETAVEGVVGRVSAPIRQGGIGEVVYEQMGARRSVPARSEDGAPIPKQEEVFVVRYEKGIANVRRWEEVLEEQGSGNRDVGTRD